ncbi:restriction endonuclease subunit S [Flavicella sediminum]|uniref:restriction endonuclease subunit S n=1 Tax=Flavicella sediminum TaxID=2585141 RepID=UPI00140904B7|nr:restriction endonuclease subunit S [Flavicella sediminum]
MYSISSNINDNKIFLVNKSELASRLDPNYLKIKKEIVDNFKFPLEKIGTSFIIKDGDHDKLPENAISDKENGKRYLRAQDLKNDRIINEKPIYITEDYFNKVKRCHIYPGDLLLSIMASVGAASIVPENFQISTANRAIGILRRKPNSKFLAEYLQVLINTNVGLSLFEIEKKGGIQQRLNLSDIANVSLPCPSFEIQNTIINIYKIASETKKIKKEEAKSLLESIDSYLLKELNVNLPIKDNSFSNRYFEVNWSELSGDRLDADYHHTYFKLLNESLREGKYKYLPIRKYASFQAGYAFKSEDYVSNSKCFLITIRNIKENLIDINKTTFLPDDFLTKYTEYRIKKNDLLIAMTGATIGKVGIYQHNKNALLNQRNGIIKPDNINSEYLMNILNLSIYQEKILRNSNGGAQPNISETDIMKILIPVPPIEKQNEIANHISKLREKAKELELEAKNELKDAKNEIEKMIIG